MKILEVEMEGFRRHKDPVIVALPDGDVEIRGENGAGKTTIAEAITWGLFGVDLAGSNRVDRLMHPETGGVMVSVRVIGPDGQEDR
ncbi:MAG: AAA family ATPase, partial [Symbiobacteriaceae bacterium]